MKKLFFVSALFAGLSFANAQKVNEASVPIQVMSKFKSLYPGIATVKWEKEKDNYEANFKHGKASLSILISPAGNLLETEEAIEISALPQVVSDYLVKNLPAKKIDDASKIIDAQGKITYEVGVNGMDYTFDENGNFLKKEKDTD
jgi:hypothetical protein